jgi:hypothetical protein
MRAYYREQKAYTRARTGAGDRIYTRKALRRCGRGRVEDGA